MMQATGLQDLQVQCEVIGHLLEREYAVLRSRNGLRGEGVDELTQLQQEKEEQITRLDRLARDALSGDPASRTEQVTTPVRQALEHCKALQSRNHLLFGRIVHTQRRLLDALTEGKDNVSLYDRGGRTQDFVATRRYDSA